MAERSLSRPQNTKNYTPISAYSARLESPPANELRVHPAAADGYRSRSGAHGPPAFLLNLDHRLQLFGPLL